jgi:hypothetical protein
MIKDVKPGVYEQYMLDVNLEHALKTLAHKRLSPRARSIEKDRLLDEYCRQSVLNRKRGQTKN